MRNLGWMCCKVPTPPNHGQVDFKPQIVSNVKLISIKRMFYAGVGTGNRLRREHEDLKRIGILGGLSSKFFWEQDYDFMSNNHFICRHVDAPREYNILHVKRS